MSDKRSLSWWEVVGLAIAVVGLVATIVGAVAGVIEVLPDNGSEDDNDTVIITPTVANSVTAAGGDAPTQVPTATLPPSQAPTVSPSVRLTVIPNAFAIALCAAGNSGVQNWQDLRVTLGVGTGEVIRLAETELASAAQTVAPGTCLCLNNNDTNVGGPDVCANAEVAFIDAEAGSWGSVSIKIDQANTQVCELSPDACENGCLCE